MQTIYLYLEIKEIVISHKRHYAVLKWNYPDGDYPGWQTKEIQEFIQKHNLPSLAGGSFHEFKRDGWHSGYFVIDSENIDTIKEFQEWLDDLKVKLLAQSI